MRVENTAEGGVNGGIVTAANSGAASGTAWTTVSIGLTAVFAYDTSTFGYGTTSYRASNGITLGANNALWDSTVVGAVSRMYGRAYVRFAAPGYLREILRWRSGSTQVGKVGISAAGKLELRNAAGTTVATGNTVLAANTWYRIEYDMRPGATQTNTVRLYVSHGTTPVETLTATDNFSTATTINEFGIGQFVTAVLLPDMWLDSIVATDVGWPGPALITEAATRCVSPNRPRDGAGLRPASGGRVSTGSAARTGTGAKSATGDRVTGANATRAGSGLKAVTASRHTGSSTARVGSGAKQATAVRPAEVDAARPGAGLRTAAGVRVTEADTPRIGAGSRLSDSVRQSEMDVPRTGTNTKQGNASRVAEADTGRVGTSTLTSAGAPGWEVSSGRTGAGRTVGDSTRNVEVDAGRPGVATLHGTGDRVSTIDAGRTGAGSETGVGHAGSGSEARTGEGFKTSPALSRTTEIDQPRTGMAPTVQTGARVVMKSVARPGRGARIQVQLVRPATKSSPRRLFRRRYVRGMSRVIPTLTFDPSGISTTTVRTTTEGVRQL